ncbi:MAG: DnaJ domain-containing protein [Rhizobiaceae bacterium]
MTAVAWLSGVVFVAGLLALGFLRADAGSLARALRIAGPVAMGFAGFALLFLGRVAAGGFLLSIAAGWFASSRLRGPRGSGGGRRKKSSVRTAALEMELDHETGGLEGMVLAGRHENRVLGEMKLAELLELRVDLAGDGESLQLLETYLDGRFPVWRDDAQAHGDDRKGVAPGSGAMTKEEAYKVLGLESGASAADVRKAHRRLMQRLHPDMGGSSFLAARINEAKDVLLSDHN